LEPPRNGVPGEGVPKQSLGTRNENEVGNEEWRGPAAVGAGVRAGAWRKSRGLAGRRLVYS
jgi:hypothetical protein